MSTTHAAPPAAQPSLFKYLYTHNPFYAVSAVLMLFSIRAAYGTLEIGAINSWLMMGVLAAYTSVLAVIGVLIVRWGKVWEDARSIVLLLLLLFLAVSISADDLFSNIGTARPGAALLLFGYLFSAVVSEAVLRGAGIRLRLLCRVPYHLMLALFYLAPWWYTPELHPRSRVDQEWAIFMFPIVAAGLFLCLLPAVRRGPNYVQDNGTPWSWPWFPWTAFGVIAAAVALRSYTLSMVFSLNGTIWKELPSGRAIDFNTIWGSYFLVPLAFAILLLLLEAAVVTRNRLLQFRVLRAAPVLLLLSMPLGSSGVFLNFLQRVTDRLGSPVWLTVLLLIGFYTWAWLRRVQFAGYGVVATLALLAIVGRNTVDLDTLGDPQYWPFVLIAPMLFVHGIWTRSSLECAAAGVSVAVGLWLFLPQTPLAEFRMTTSYHVLWAAILAVGFSFQDPLAKLLRVVAALMVPLASMAVVSVTGVPNWWRAPYVAAAAATCLAISIIWHNRWFLYSCGASVGILIYAGLVLLFRRGVDILGWPAVTAFLWSLGMLLLGFLISAHKARWLRKPPLPWRNGNGAG